MRIKEWYSWHFPELKDIVKDNYMYARVIKAIQSRAFFQAEDCVEKLKAVVLDEDEKALHDLWEATSFELDKLQSNQEGCL